jgi:hypothetical protein
MDEAESNWKLRGGESGAGAMLGLAVTTQAVGAPS